MTYVHAKVIVNYRADETCQVFRIQFYLNGHTSSGLY